MSQPHLYLLHRYPVGQQQAGAGVPQIVEAYLLQTKFLYQVGKMLRYKVRPEQLPRIIYADIFPIILAVAALKDCLHKLLLFFFLQQQLLNNRQQWQRPYTGLGFQHVFAHRHKPAVHLGFNDFMIDCQSFLLKVYRLPFKPQHLAAPQSVIRRYLYRQFQWIALNHLEERQHFCFCIMSRLVAVLFRLIHAVCRVTRYQLLFNCALQGFPQHCVVMNHRIGSVTLVQNYLVEILYLSCRYAA